jgi:hypothetical protein
MKFINSIDQLGGEKKYSNEYLNEYGNASEESRACAKVQSSDTGTRYYILQSNAQRKIFNPIIDDFHKKLPGRSEHEFKLTECSKEAFDAYADYLKTKNPLMLKKAEICVKR